MPKILILTKAYPANDVDFHETKVVHYFAREFVKMGYEVKVIHNHVLFPRIICFLGLKFQELLKSIFNATVPFFYDEKINHYQIDNVDVNRIPIKKILPHGMIRKDYINKHFDKIIDILHKDDFKPDVVIGHWWSPQLELLSLFKEKFGCRTSMIVHNIPSLKNRKKMIPYFKDVDIWGFRSKNLQKKFQSFHDTVYKKFLCYSGIPSAFIRENSKRNFGKERLSIAFVGSLISRKHPVAILNAVKKLNGDGVDKVLFVGQGSEEKKIRYFAEFSDLKTKVSLLGFVPREKINQILQETDVFVMISEAEAFGLVYLEAMGAGCLTIASRNEGMDGIIIDGKNGFLCKAGDESELVSILKKILDMNAIERKKISDSAIDTAKQNTDYLAAERYIKNVFGKF